jgi:GNAT superfamily N-acetyltransferase
LASVSLSPPELLNETHSLDSFDSGVASLDDWLRRRARANQASGASRTYVAASAGGVFGYYCLAAGAMTATDAPGGIRRNMPDPIPMAVLGRLAVDRSWQGKGLGRALLQDAVLRTAQAASIMGVRGLLVHAISESARVFYERHGFVASPANPMTLVLSLKGLFPATPPAPASSGR